MIKEGQNYLVKRYPGADPRWLIAKPTFSLYDKLLGWEDRTGMCYEHYDDDKIFLLDESRMERVHTQITEEQDPLPNRGSI